MAVEPGSGCGFKWTLDRGFERTPGGQRVFYRRGKKKGGPRRGKRVIDALAGLGVRREGAGRGRSDGRAAAVLGDAALEEDPVAVVAARAGAGGVAAGVVRGGGVGGLPGGREGREAVVRVHQGRDRAVG